MSKPIAKRRANVTIAGDILEAARGLDLNVSAIAEAALDRAVRQARAKAWREENAEAIAQRKAWYEEHGMPLAPYQMWDPGN